MLYEVITKGAPHVRMVVERFPVVGKLEESAAPPAKAASHLKGIIIAIITVVVLMLAAILSR